MYKKTLLILFNQPGVSFEVQGFCGLKYDSPPGSVYWVFGHVDLSVDPTHTKNVFVS